MSLISGGVMVAQKIGSQPPLIQAVNLANKAQGEYEAMIRSKRKPGRFQVIEQGSMALLASYESGKEVPLFEVEA